MPPLSLYVHLPWCVAKCPYCDFNSHRAGAAPPRARYLDALERDLESEAGRTGGRPIGTVFLGGGTPSLFSGAEIARLLGAIRRNLDVAADAEITMEANPGTVDRGEPEAFREAGITRLSLGAQSFDAGSLVRLGRIHGPDDVLAAFARARRAGFDNINLDLMFGLPSQDAAMAAADIEQAIRLGPEHISYYQLTLETNTVFHARPPADLPDEDETAAMQELALERLAAAGYERYEVSAFAREGFRCRHNLNYWEFGDYLAVGAGAHGKYTDQDGAVHRYRKPANPASYMDAALAGAGWPPARRLVAGDLEFEYMLNVLRLPAGFTEAGFEERTGLDWACIEARIAEAGRTGLIRRDGARWRPTELGFRFLNELQARFLPAAQDA